MSTKPDHPTLLPLAFHLLGELATEIDFYREDGKIGDFNEPLNAMVNLAIAVKLAGLGLPESCSHVLNVFSREKRQELDVAEAYAGQASLKSQDLIPTVTAALLALAHLIDAHAKDSEALSLVGEELDIMEQVSKALFELHQPTPAIVIDLLSRRKRGLN